MALLTTSGLVKVFTSDRVIHFPNIDIAQGESLMIHGPSGSGKTTLMHIISAIIKPTSGSIVIDNTAILNLSSKECDRFRGKKIGICFQRPIFIRSLTVLENLMMTQKLSGVTVDKKKCINLLQELNLLHTSGQLTHTLSQGEQQRLVFLRSLVNQPKLILADEPSSSLDDVNASIIIDMMRNHAEEHNASLIVVSHDERIKKFFNNKISLS